MIVAIDHIYHKDEYIGSRVLGVYDHYNQFYDSVMAYLKANYPVYYIEHLDKTAFLTGHNSMTGFHSYVGHLDMPLNQTQSLDIEVEITAKD